MRSKTQAPPLALQLALALAISCSSLRWARFPAANLQLVRLSEKRLGLNAHVVADDGKLHRVTDTTRVRQGHVARIDEPFHPLRSAVISADAPACDEAGSFAPNIARASAATEPTSPAPSSEDAPSPQPRLRAPRPLTPCIVFAARGAPAHRRRGHRIAPRYRRQFGEGITSGTSMIEGTVSASERTSTKASQ